MVEVQVQPIKKLETIEDVIEDLLWQQSQLAAYIAEREASGTLEAGERSRLLTVYGQNASRVGRLLRDQRALNGRATDGLFAALATVLDELGTELGVKL